MQTLSLKKIKTINSHTGFANWLIQVDEEPVGFLARFQVRDIRSPYRYSPTCQILNWDGRQVVWFETSHKRYEIFEVPSDMQRFVSDEEATEAHVRFNLSQEAR
jgi:hypothetical protein